MMVGSTGRISLAAAVKAATGEKVVNANRIALMTALARTLRALQIFFTTNLLSFLISASLIIFVLFFIKIA
jgi:hypothetical protein